ncbi:MAG: putative transcriptional regulator, Crp/Fnr family [Chloroflexi bacterium CSP1-4]|nr:MAG: putative transcriptional regulator, Crp/Fnr family [Chloroflexi bacterium CSP1-4]
MTMTVAERAALLSRVTLFAGLPEASLQALAELAGEAEFGDGDAIVLQGQVGTGLFVIVAGAARVVRGGEELDRLGPGDYLGELAVIDRMPRMASVFAVGPTTCLALASWDLFRRVDGDPELVHSLLRGLALRVRHLSEHHSH